MTRSDQEIKQDIIDHLAWDNRVDASEVTVAVNTGVVALTGTLPSYFSRQCAESDAAAVPGVCEVQNRTTVQRPAGTPGPTDAEIEAAALEALSVDPDIDVIDVMVTVRHGSVTIGGSVDAFWKKKRTEELLARLPGVTDVENQLTIVPTHDFVDQEIAADINAAMERDVFVDPEEVNVRVKDGAVTLSGTAPNWAARTAAARIAMNTAGVQQVRNEMEAVVTERATPEPV